MIADIYLGTLSRFPTPQEVELMKQPFDSAESTRLQAVEDVLWSVLNTKEFLYNN
jgi:hypothetical protein